MFHKTWNTNQLRKGYVCICVFVKEEVYDQCLKKNIFLLFYLIAMAISRVVLHIVVQIAKGYIYIYTKLKYHTRISPKAAWNLNIKIYNNTSKSKIQK